MAKASRRPMTMQLVMIKPIKTDNCLYISKENAINTSLTKVTKLATTANWTMILILEGIEFLINEMARLAIDITKITDKAITSVGCNWVVTAKAEQIPNT